MMWRSAVVLAAGLSAACNGVTGTGSVTADFFVDDCPPGTERDLSDYEFEADWLATERFSGVLIIMVQEYRVRVEETDGLGVRIELQDLIDSGKLVIDEAADQIVSADGATIVLPVATEGVLANASLSLFQTCPNFPTLHATSGTLTLTEFAIALDPGDTGRGERLAGSITATIARSTDLAVPSGVVSGRFEFEPPTRPTTSFK